jgi:hypothetical protein
MSDIGRAIHDNSRTAAIRRQRQYKSARGGVNTKRRLLVLINARIAYIIFDFALIMPYNQRK